MLSLEPDAFPRSEAPSASNAPSRDEIRGRIVAEFALALHVDPASIDTAATLFSLGADSLIAISITGALSEWLGRDLQATLMWDHPSIDAIAEALSVPPAAEGVLPSGIIALHTGGTRTPLFCFPGAGGHSTTFAPLATHIGTDRSVYGLIVPGMNGEQAPFTHVEEIAEEMLQAIRRVQPNGPYQFAAYSFGGLLALEVAQRVQALGESVSLLAIYDTFTSAGLVLRPRWQRMALHAYLLATRSGRLEYIRKQLRRRRGEREALELLQRQVGTPSKSSNRIASEVLFANIHAASAYAPSQYSGSIVLFQPATRAVETIFYKTDKATNGWGALAPGRVRTIDLPGSHLTMLEPEYACMAAERLRPFLSQ
jgi:thioesterase domain-containing protein/acyl carrier protein